MGRLFCLDLFGPGIFVDCFYNKGRALALWGERKASVQNCTDDPKDLGTYMNSIHATHLAVFKDQSDCASMFAEKFPEVAKLVFENRVYKIYQILPNSF